MKSIILVTGASGFVGQAVCQAAAARGYEVRSAVRKAGEMASVQAYVVGEIDACTDWMQALQGAEVVIHLAARVHVMKDVSADPLAEFRRVNVQGTENLARQAAATGVKRMVYVSSIKVNGEGTTGTAYSELDAPNPQYPYGISKFEAEQALHRVAKETGLEVVIVRPPLVYGPGVKGNFLSLFKAISKGLPLPLAGADNARSLVYVGNLVDALLTCATHPAAAGQTYLVSDGEDISTSNLLRNLGDAMGHPARLFPAPPSLLKLVGRLTGKSAPLDRLLCSLQIDSGKIRRELNWTPPYSLQQGLQVTAEWFRKTHL